MSAPLYNVFFRIAISSRCVSAYHGLLDVIVSKSGPLVNVCCRYDQLRMKYGE